MRLTLPSQSNSEPHLLVATSVFVYASGSWTQRGSSIVGSEANELFGGAVSLNYHGTVVAIGAQGYSSGSSGRNRQPFIPAEAHATHAALVMLWSICGAVTFCPLLARRQV